MSKRIDDPKYGSCFIMRDNKGKIQYIRKANMKDKLNFQIYQIHESFDDLPEQEKLRRMKYSSLFFFTYYISFLFCPLILGLGGHYSKEDNISKEEKKNFFVSAITLSIIYILIGISSKVFIKDINKAYTKWPSALISFDIFYKFWVLCFVYYLLCLYNKTVIYFLSILNIFYFAHILFYLIVYTCKVIYLLRIYLLTFIFYQITRLIIILCAMIMIFFNATNFEIYIYLAIIAFISSYMYFDNYFITLQHKIKYNNLMQGIVNYPFEWINLFYCLCKKPENNISENTERNHDCCLDCEKQLAERCPSIIRDEEKIYQERQKCSYKLMQYCLCCCNCCCNCCCCCDDFKFWESLEDFDKYNEK